MPAILTVFKEEWEKKIKVKVVVFNYTVWFGESSFRGASLPSFVITSGLPTYTTIHKLPIVLELKPEK